jgi:hypothetical protein
MDTPTATKHVLTMSMSGGNHIKKLVVVCRDTLETFRGLLHICDETHEYCDSIGHFLSMPQSALADRIWKHLKEEYGRGYDDRDEGSDDLLSIRTAFGQQQQCPSTCQHAQQTGDQHRHSSEDQTQWTIRLVKDKRPEDQRVHPNKADYRANTTRTKHNPSYPNGKPGKGVSSQYGPMEVGPGDDGYRGNNDQHAEHTTAEAVAPLYKLR